MHSALALPWMNSLSAIFSSTEQKAIDGAEILANHLKLDVEQIENLGENDRSSTGFLTPDEFERTADEFFNFPTLSVRGWETAQAAQDRIVKAVAHISDSQRSDGAIAIVSHGAVGTLLYCHHAKQTIDRQWDQPGNGGGNYLKLLSVPSEPPAPELTSARAPKTTTPLTPSTTCEWWRPIDA